MSISRIQTERALKEIVRHLYSEGVEPMFREQSAKLAAHFSEVPPGTPLLVPQREDFVGTSNATNYNRLVRNLALNLDVLYEASLSQVDSVLELTQAMVLDLERLSVLRDRLEGQVDDYLMSLYNTDGYFYSVTDNFADIEFIDLNFTNTFVDTDSRSVVLSPITSGTKKLSPDQYSLSRVNVTVNDEPVDYRELAGFTGAVEDTLENILWAVEVQRETPAELIATLSFRIGEEDAPVTMTEMSFVPYGSSPVQVFVETSDVLNGDFDQFGNRIKTSVNKMIFEDADREVREVRFTLRKTEPDFTDQSTGRLLYYYIFGAKEIAITRQVHERQGTLVSTPFGIPEDLADEMAIDRVSLVVDDDTPEGTQINYFLAAETGEEELLSDYQWRQMRPLDSDAVGNRIINFSGAAPQMRRIRQEPEGDDLELIEIQQHGPTEGLNPNPAIVPGVDIYRIAEFEGGDLPLAKSMSLVEGVNSTTIYSKQLDPDAMSLEYWGDQIKNHKDELTIDFGRIDIGHEFFYGGDLGAPNRSAYIETYLDSPHERALFLSEFKKADRRSLDWDVKVYLNSDELGHLPQGVGSAMLPWRFKEGLNHVALLVNIPEEGTVPNIYTGVLRPFANHELFDFGDVYIARWHYVDLFTLQYNELGSPKTFSFYNNEIISRRRPTTNMLLHYSTKTGSGPEAVRLRADFERDTRSSYVTPQLNKYTLRFSYR